MDLKGILFKKGTSLQNPATKTYGRVQNLYKIETQTEDNAERQVSDTRKPRKDTTKLEIQQNLEKWVSWEISEQKVEIEKQITLRVKSSVNEIKNYRKLWNQKRPSEGWISYLKGNKAQRIQV